MSTRNLARDERERLCDLALELGPDAPTLCGDWTVRDLIAHLLVRERDPIAATGIWMPGLGGLTRWAMDRRASGDFEAIVSRLRSPGLSPVNIPKIDRAFNTMEFFIHHEDIRRAQEGWQPRKLKSGEQSQIWGGLKAIGKSLLRRADVPVVAQRTDKEREAVLRKGVDPVTITGLPSELAMFCFGRAQCDGLEFSGPEDSVARLKHAALGI